MQSHNQNSKEKELEFHVESSQHSEGWLVSYADMMTLLFGLFVILFSISSVNKGKYEELRKSVAQEFSKNEYHHPIEKVERSLYYYLGLAGISPKMADIKSSADGLEISLRGVALFESGGVVPVQEGIQFINQVAQAILKSEGNYLVKVEGHTDDVPLVGSVYPSNWELSAARASGVVRRLEEAGIASENLSAIGYGSSHPLFPNRTSSGEAIAENMNKNRRVVVFITKKD